MLGVARPRSSSPRSIAVAHRPRGRVLVDYNQNAWGRTLASVYSVRPHAPGRGLDAGDLEGDRARRRRSRTSASTTCPARVREARRSLEAAARAAQAASSWRHCCDACRCRATIAPMEAQPVGEIPPGDEWEYEPKWDGFRCIAFRDGERVDLHVEGGAAARPLLPRDRRGGRGASRRRGSCSTARSSIPDGPSASRSTTSCCGFIRRRVGSRCSRASTRPCCSSSTCSCSSSRSFAGAAAGRNGGPASRSWPRDPFAHRRASGFLRRPGSRSREALAALGRRRARRRHREARRRARTGRATGPGCRSSSSAVRRIVSSAASAMRRGRGSSARFCSGSTMMTGSSITSASARG